MINGLAPWFGGKRTMAPLIAEAIGPHHSIATHAARWGLGPLALKELLRHTFITTQDHYREIDLANRVETARRITFKAIS